MSWFLNRSFYYLSWLRYSYKLANCCSSVCLDVNQGGTKWQRLHAKTCNLAGTDLHLRHCSLIYLLIAQVLGDHVDTSESYRKLSELMLRRRLAEPAVAFSGRAVEMLHRLGADATQAELTAARALCRMQRSAPQENPVPTNVSIKPVLYLS